MHRDTTRRFGVDHYVEIGGKKRKVLCTYKHLRAIRKKYNMDDIQKWPAEMYDEYVADCTWIFLRRNILGLKPFICKKHMVGKLTIAEHSRLRFDVSRIMQGKAPYTDQEIEKIIIEADAKTIEESSAGKH